MHCRFFRDQMESTILLSKWT